MTAKLTRRGAIVALGAAGVSAGVTKAHADPMAGAVFVDSRLSAHELRLVAPFLKGKTAVRLEAEVVRGWRDRIERQFVTAGALEFLVRWDHANLLCDLAREAGGRAQMLRPAGGVFAVLMSRGKLA